jgi:homoserine dehydrogenase
VEDTLQLCRVTEIKGILNSTTNFILDELAKGREYADVIREGKERALWKRTLPWISKAGMPRQRTAVLLNVLMGADITPDRIDRTGIEGITQEQIRKAEERGKVIRLVCRGFLKEGKAAGRVAPEEIDKNELFATISGTSSVVSVATDLMGTVSIVEHDPGIIQTGYGILSDLLRVIRAIS